MSNCVIQTYTGRLVDLLNPKPQRRVFEYLVKRQRGQERGRTDTAEACGYTASSGTWRNLLSEMKSLGLVRYPKQTTVAATALLFPEGLR